MSRAALLPMQPTSAEDRPSKSHEIKARIAANRDKRLAIAKAMKREAGVTGHEVNTEDLSGLADLATGQIISPEGRNIAHLHVLAHECGHIFLHGSAPGRSLPTHVAEMQAESYAHQCLREHGMAPNRSQTDWGRRYVASWIEKDRASGFRIDPAVVDYAQGRRSPYEPLPFAPPTWKLHKAIYRAGYRPWLIPVGRRSGWRGWADEARLAIRRWLWRHSANPASMVREAWTIGLLSGKCLLFGTMILHLGLPLIRALLGVPRMFDPWPGHDGNVADLLEALVWAPVLTALAILAHTWTRRPVPPAKVEPLVGPPQRSRLASSTIQAVRSE